MSDVPEGYRMSEVGVIPEDWEIDKIKTISSITTGAKNTQDKIDEGEYPFFVRSSIVERINSYSFDGEAVLTAGDGVGTGKVFHYINGKFDFHQRVYKMSDFSEKIDGYFFYLFFSNHFLKRITAMTAKSSVDSVRMEMIAEMPIPLPPLPEQQAIASALSDVDALITALEQLITKKRNIKQGAMQQLLTGKKRLPGFGGEWEVKTLENVCAKNGLVRGPFGGTLKKEFFVRNGLKVYEQKNAIYRNLNLGNYFIDKNKFNELKRFEVKKGDFIVSCSGTIGKIYQIPKCAECGIINQALLKIKTDDDIIHDRFFFYYFDWEKFQEEIIDNTQGGAMQNIVGMNIFRNTQILLPPLPEQQAIAQILSDMDTEIEALEQKRDKYRTIKQGMMQELLTGKTRLAKEDKT